MLIFNYKNSRLWSNCKRAAETHGSKIPALSTDISKQDNARWYSPWGTKQREMHVNIQGKYTQVLISTHLEGFGDIPQNRAITIRYYLQKSVP